MHAYIYSIYNCIYIYIVYIYSVYIYSLLIARSCKARPWGKAWKSTRPVLGTSPSSAGNLGHRPARWPYPSQASKNGIWWQDLKNTSEIQNKTSYRRKFRSETSDNMDSWKAQVRRVRREKIRRKKMQVREKVGTSWNTESRETLCFPDDLGLREVEK